MVMTRLENLKALNAKVRAGDFRDREGFPLMAACNLGNYRSFGDAFDGSTDAAIAFHEAALPGWDFSVSTSWVTICRASVSKSGRGEYNAEADHPARALLLADLQALIAIEGDG